MARKSLIVKSRRQPKFSVRRYHRCLLCGRSRGYMKRFSMCRICFRKLALWGRIPGVCKSSW